MLKLFVREKLSGDETIESAQVSQIVGDAEVELIAVKVSFGNAGREGHCVVSEDGIAIFDSRNTLKRTVRFGTSLTKAKGTFTPPKRH